MKHKFLTNLIEFTNTEVTFNREQLRLYRNGQVSLYEIWIMNKVDNEIADLDSKAYSLLVGLVAALLGALEVNNINLLVSVPVALVDPMDAINNLGNTFLGVFKGLGYWVCIIFCFIDIIKTMMKGGKSSQELFGVIFKNILIFASMYLVPYFFDIIRNAF